MFASFFKKISEFPLKSCLLALMIFVMMAWPSITWGANPIVTRNIPNGTGPMITTEHADITLAETPEEFTTALNFQANEIARRNTELSRLGQDAFDTGKHMEEYKTFKAFAEGKIGSTKPADWSDEQWQNYNQALTKYKEAENVYRENVNLNQSNQDIIRNLEDQLAKDPNNQDLKDALAAREAASASTVKGQCGWFDWTCAVEEIVGIWLSSIQLILFGPLLGLAAFFFNLALSMSVENLDQFLQISGVIKAWSVMRDLCNIVFIFVLLYGAINIMIGKSGTDVNRLISGVIIAALLVNFSGFFVRSLVDVSNLVTVTFNDQISKNASGGASGSLDKSIGLAKNLLNAVKLTSVEEPVPGYPGITQVKRTSLASMIISFLFSIVFALVFIFVLFYLTFVFLLRTVAIIFIFIMSPLAIVGRFLPDNIGMSFWNQWWKPFKENLLFAPLLLFNLYWILLILDSGVASIVGTTGISSVSSSMGLDLFRGSLDAMVFYIFAIFLLFMGISTAKTSAGAIGGMAGKAAGFVGGAVLAGGAAGATKLAQKSGATERLSNWYHGSSAKPARWFNAPSRGAARVARAVGRTGVGKKLASPVSSTLGYLGARGVPGIDQKNYDDWSKRWGWENKELDEQLTRRYKGSEEEDRSGADKFKAFQKMSYSDQARLYSKLSGEDRSKLENEAKKAFDKTKSDADKKQFDAITKLRGELKGKAVKDLKTASTKLEQDIRKKEVLDEAKGLFDKEKRPSIIAKINQNIPPDISDPEQRKLKEEEGIMKKIRAITPNDFEEFFLENRKDIMSDPIIYRSFTTGQLNKLSNVADEDEKAKIKAEITKLATPSTDSFNPRSGDPIAEKSRAWMGNLNNTNNTF